MPFRLKHVHVYALVNNQEVALFDTGFNISGAYEKLEKDLESIGLGIKAVRDIYLTHNHADHCGMAGLIKEKSGATIHLSRAADESNQNYLKTDLVIRQVKKFYMAHGFTEKEVDALINVFSGLRGLITEFKGDDLLAPADLRTFGNWQFEAIFTPGHSNGHICYFFRENGFLLSGDTVLPQITPNLSPDLFDESFRPLHSFRESLKVVEKLPITRIYPGHGNAFSDVKIRAGEMRGHHAERSQLILDCITSTPKTTLEISREIFSSELGDFDKFLALNETYVHLLELKLAGAIREEQAGNNLVYTIGSAENN
jgi:glyoxylase-like metal-dependent hydrolase (beta-lactamase superfamily II)